MNNTAIVPTMNALTSAKQRVIARALTKRDSSAVLQQHCGGKEIVIEIGLMAIGVGLLLMFRTQIGALLSSMFTEASGKITGMFTEVAGS